MQNEKSKWSGGKLLTIENAKTVKGESLGYLTGILYLAPADESVPFGGKNLCPLASKGCAAACLFSAGRGRFDAVRNARIAKTLHFVNDFQGFEKDLFESVARVVRAAKRQNLTPAIRLNGTSDVAWEKISGIMNAFPDVIFYDYSKTWSRVLAYSRGELPANYHLTFSRSEENADKVELIIAETDANVAVVFASKNLPASYMGREVINGDEHDLRFLDKKGVIVGLSAKGKAKRDTSGFVVGV